MARRDLQQVAWLRAEIARITEAAQVRVGELRMPAGATRAQRREVQAARRAVWADRDAAIRALTVASRGPSRAERSAANKAAHASSEVSQQIQRRRAERAARRDRQALYRASEQQERTR
jgi:hypothetical protein